MISKEKMSGVIGVAFVWFTTQFGGGFASGAQLKSYFINYGIWCLFVPILAQGVIAFYQWYALKYAKNHDVYDYRSFNDRFYGKTAPLFSNLYELLYLVLLGVAPSVAFATGGATMKALFNLPYLLCTAIIGLFIFVVAVYGTNVVRKVASTLSVMIIAGLLILFVPNIIVQWDAIVANIGLMAATPAPVGPALWKGFVYACFQLAAIGLLVQHAKPFESTNDAKRSMIYGFLVNSGIVLLATLGLLAIVSLPEYETASIPILVLVQNGVGATFLTPVISLLIVLGSVSTAVNMIAGITNRVMVKFEPEKLQDKKPSKLAIITTLGFTILAFGISQFGLLPLISKGYGFLGYLTIPIVMIPYLYHMYATKMDTKDIKTENMKSEKAV